jgi:NAD(P) transhydrogenase subunit alpha
MDASSINEQSMRLLQAAEKIVLEAGQLDLLSKKLARSSAYTQLDPFVVGLTVFVLACFVGYFVVWKVTPALHSPLMAVTNAISSVIIVGALMSMGKGASTISLTLGFLAIVVASINIFGGFMVTQRMLMMFSKKK